MGLFSSKKSTTKTEQTFNDNRTVNDAGGGLILSGTGNTVALSDPGAVQLGRFNAELLGAVAESQTDAIKFITQAGLDTVRAAASAGNVLEQGAQNMASGAPANDDDVLDAAPSPMVLAGVAVLALFILKG